MGDLWTKDFKQPGGPGETLVRPASIRQKPTFHSLSWKVPGQIGDKRAKSFVRLLTTSETESANANRCVR